MPLNTKPLTVVSNFFVQAEWLAKNHTDLNFIAKSRESLLAAAMEDMYAVKKYDVDPNPFSTWRGRTRWEEGYAGVWPWGMEYGSHDWRCWERARQFRMLENLELY